MSLDSRLPERLRFLIRVVRKECMHLQTTDLRLFAAPFTSQTVAQLDRYPDLAERVDAFASRFGRLQDTLGDKLLPLLLRALGEKAAAAIDKTSTVQNAWVCSPQRMNGWPCAGSGTRWFTNTSKARKYSPAPC